MSVGRIFRALVDCFEANNVLTYASAVAFQLLVALVPLAALGLVFIGLVGAEDVWRHQLAPLVEEKTTPVMFIALDAMVERLITSPPLLWLALGVALALWEVSGSVRAVMGATNTIYGLEERRGIVRRFGLSFLLALGVIAAVLGAGWTATFSSAIPFLPAAVEIAVRWLVALVLVWLMLLMLLRYAPVETRPVRWISVGSVIVVVTWLGASALYGFYVQNVVSFTSPLGLVAVGLVTTGYVYTSSIVFLLGVQVDELLHSERREELLGV